MRTLLIANRGEIARRVIRTARELGIRTVAVYSDPDARAPHVTDADVAIALGGTTSAESYLDVDKVLAAARRSGADAVHPGYGFLSENAEFAEACALAGITFIGPAPDTIRDMGLKDRAKDLARKAGVPVLPDARVTGEDPGAWLAEADEVGFPLLVKATAGGGGKGMRLVPAREDLVEAIDGARREAGNSFGNSTVFLERYLQASRHIEIQVFGDAHGNAVHLGERECSIQRRHQKVLEEAPSPVVTPELREAMGGTAVSLVRELGYLGAGTVEYLFDDQSGEFFFLEMNTRLQVEHPVTEEVYGLDLVALQLRVARGEKLGLVQDEIVPRGHAIEVRLYAEDPAQNYRPTPGPLHRYAHPDGPALRFEDGVAAPGEVSPFYDPMLAKVIARGDTRSEAAGVLARALEATQVHGVVTNRDFLAALLRDPDFLAGRTRTDFLDHHAELLDPPPGTPPVVHLAAAIAVSVALRRTPDSPSTLAPPGFRLLAAESLTRREWQDSRGDVADVGYRITGNSGDTELVLEVDGQRHDLSLFDLRPDTVRVRHEGVDRLCRVAFYDDGSVWVNDSSAQSRWDVLPRLPEASAALAAAGPVSELPGTVVAVLVEKGQQVVAGQKLVMVEAMKMEHAALADTDGVVADIHVSVGQYVEAKAVLVTLEHAPDA